ncbi:JAB domain-containing protein [Candidatus Pacearchaeota archaeon]|nr:JAB domain-containing protein [Candidatus Pacearchaeota archaeon]
MKIKDMPKEGRPRERFLKKGPDALSDAELFAIFLRVGTKGENVVDMSNRLIAEYGLDRLFECSLKELQKIKGIGPDKAMQILAMAELGMRYNHLRKQNNKNQKKITCAEDVFNYFHERLRDKKQEEFWVLMLNTKNKVIGEHLVSKGILDASIVHPREVFRPAIKNAASKIILVHNHPSGDCEASGEDEEITKILMIAGKNLDIKVVDHVIIAGGEYRSIK